MNVRCDLVINLVILCNMYVTPYPLQSSDELYSDDETEDDDEDLEENLVSTGHMTSYSGLLTTAPPGGGGLLLLMLPMLSNK